MDTTSVSRIDVTDIALSGGQRSRLIWYIIYCYYNSDNAINRVDPHLSYFNHMTTSLTAETVSRVKRELALVRILDNNNNTEKSQVNLSVFIHIYIYKYYIQVR